MLFNSTEFLVFLPIVLALYYSLASRPQNVMLLAASYVFYGWWDWRFLGLLVLSTVLDFMVGLWLHAVAESRRKAVLTASLVVNLTILGFFKYFNFFIGSATEVLTRAGWQIHSPVLNIVLPVGISFYTFQSLSYTIDVYRGKLQPERNLLDYALFVAFFPQLVAGPIERADHLIRQLTGRRIVNAQMVYSGVLLMLIGYVKKVGIADSVAPTVTDVFSQAGTLSWVVLLKGIWFFTIQIYCDFSGYTDIARGCSRLLGVELMENFNQPYFSANITEFWRRWHISLSTWLRDYLYIPLGGNRGGPAKRYRNLMITMLLGGLWHGANWTFVVWGGLHGTYLTIHKFLLDRRSALTVGAETGPRTHLRQVVCVLGTLHLVMLTWVFFRAGSITEAFAFLGGLITLRGGIGAFNVADVLPILFYATLVVAIDWPQYHRESHTAILSWPLLPRTAAVGAMLLLLLILGENSETPFIYFQF
jgi:alginate O-acetyltransferase complex protein AlgI